MQRLHRASVELVLPTPDIKSLLELTSDEFGGWEAAEQPVPAHVKQQKRPIKDGGGGGDDRLSVLQKRYSARPRTRQRPSAAALARLSDPISGRDSAAALSPNRQQRRRRRDQGAAAATTVQLRWEPDGGARPLLPLSSGRSRNAINPAACDGATQATPASAASLASSALGIGSALQRHTQRPPLPPPPSQSPPPLPLPAAAIMRDMYRSPEAHVLNAAAVCAAVNGTTTGGAGGSGGGRGSLGGGGGGCGGLPPGSVGAWARRHDRGAPRREALLARAARAAGLAALGGGSEPLARMRRVDALLRAMAGRRGGAAAEAGAAGDGEGGWAAVGKATCLRLVTVDDGGNGGDGGGGAEAQRRWRQRPRPDTFLTTLAQQCGGTAAAAAAAPEATVAAETAESGSGVQVPLIRNEDSAAAAERERDGGRPQHPATRRRRLSAGERAAKVYAPPAAPCDGSGCGWRFRSSGDGGETPLMALQSALRGRDADCDGSASVATGGGSSAWSQRPHVMAPLLSQPLTPRASAAAAAAAPAPAAHLPLLLPRLPPAADRSQSAAAGIDAQHALPHSDPQRLSHSSPAAGAAAAASPGPDRGRITARTAARAAAPLVYVGRRERFAGALHTCDLAPAAPTTRAALWAAARPQAIMTRSVALAQPATWA
ncbi:hypothetical protein JKP88DRAFT_296473 [Tribonema minus]|uniref:Uncharacterized protein n=1 Tax=Tribonema minus TaxID=303371 RepID=A0A835ZDU4_9STRA|nr:hypothetical protein JKP88DRAFT_296473 [Tribonema minus]